MVEAKEDFFHLGIKALVRNPKGEILLLKTNPQALVGYDGDPYWDIPGGRLLKGSGVEETLKRELLEETGISSVKSTVPFTMALSNLRIPVGEESVGLILSVYICEVDIGEIRLSEEHLESKWFSPQEAADLLRFKYPEDFVEKLRTLE